MALVQRVGSLWSAGCTCKVSFRLAASAAEIAGQSSRVEFVLYTESAPGAPVVAGGSRHFISSEHIKLTFAELELKPVQEQVGGCRIRQHASPLKASLMAPLKTPQWDEVSQNALGLLLWSYRSFNERL